ncbi:hypothetical protein CTATCC11996_21508 [Comamonas testosteroni ATCC 11996]|nr:hypothetical protein CTATCC11996_21508 [Comamonas testosteroni ATCC 11996]
MPTFFKLSLEYLRTNIFHKDYGIEVQPFFARQQSSEGLLKHTFNVETHQS